MFDDINTDPEQLTATTAILTYCKGLWLRVYIATSNKPKKGQSDRPDHG